MGGRGRAGGGCAGTWARVPVRECVRAFCFILCMCVYIHIHLYIYIYIQLYIIYIYIYMCISMLSVPPPTCSHSKGCSIGCLYT